MVKLIAATVSASLFAAVSAGQGDAFQAAVRSYVDLHRAAAAAAPAPADDAEALYAVQQALAQRIQSTRPDARQSDILGPAAAQIRDVVRRELSGPEGAAILSAIEQSNVHGVRNGANTQHQLRSVMNDPEHIVTIAPELLLEAVRRAKAEFLEMPGLKLTAAQAARLWSVDATLCGQVLSALVESRFLAETSHSSFVRAESSGRNH